jgi:uncharacterized repeat protein (TIGR01451 family)
MRFSRFWCHFILVLAALAGVVIPARAQAPLAGTVIINRASVRYVDAATGLTSTVESNIVSAIVQAVPGLDLTADQTRRVAPGAGVVLPHLLTNTGNTPSVYSFAWSNASGDDYDLNGLRLFQDTNGNGLADSGEAEITPGQLFTLAPGERLAVVLTGMVPAGAAANTTARVTITASTADGLSDSNTDTILVVPGIAIQINKAVQPLRAVPGERLRFTITVASVGTTPPQPYTVQLDGAARQFVILRDAIPANTTFSEWGQTPLDCLRLYHIAGTPLDSYVFLPPQNLALVDAVAIAFADFGSATRTINAAFFVQVASRATGDIVNTAQFRYSNPATGPTQTQTDSNQVIVPLPTQAPAITYYTDPTYGTGAPTSTLGEPLYIQAGVAACNANSSVAEETTFTLISAVTGDTESVTARETGPNTGIFRIETPIPTRDVASNPVQRNNGILETTPRDRITVQVQSCDGQIATATIIINAFGIVYDSRSNQPISGVRVILVDASGTVLATRVTGADGAFLFPALSVGNYRIIVEPPPGYSSVSRFPPNLQPGDRVIDPNGSYGRFFTLSAAGIISFDIPLDAEIVSGLFLEKEASQQVVGLTDVLDYRLTLANRSGITQGNLVIVDDLPRGFSYVNGSGRVTPTGGAATTSVVPTGAPGPRLTFPVGSLAAEQQLVLVYRVKIGVGASSGKATNRAQATGTSPLGPLASNTATATVQIQPAVFDGRGVLIGKVFVDSNGNDIQDQAEAGIPGVRIYLENGTYAVTDSEGKYSIYGLSPRTHAVKLDTTTMPAGSKLKPLTFMHGKSGSLVFVDMRAAALEKVNFAITNPSAEVLKQIKERRLLAQKSGAETDLVGTTLQAQALEQTAAESRGLPASGTVASPTASRLTTPGGTIAMPANSRDVGVGNDDTRTSIITASPGSTLTADVLKSGNLSTVGPDTPRGTGGAATGLKPVTPDTTANTPVPGAPAGETGDTPANTTTPASPVATTPAAEDPTLVTQTIIGDVTRDGNALIDSPRKPEENLPGGASAQPVAEPIGAGNSNLPVAPVRLAATVAWDDILPSLNNDLDFYDLKDGDVLVLDQANVRIKGRAGARFELRANGELISEKRIGSRSELKDNGVQALEYIGVGLKPGPNTLEVAQFDTAGNERGRKRISVIAPGNLGRLVLRMPKSAYADGRTPISVEVSLTDSKGIPVSTRLPLTLEASLGTWQVIDVNPVEPGVQVFIEGGTATFGLLPPIETGDALVRVTSGIVGATARLSFLPDLRPLIGAGLLESQLAFFNVKQVRSNPGTLFDDQLRTISNSGSAQLQGRGAAFLKGRVKGKYLLTMRYDTQRDTNEERLFRDIQPDEYYPIYGDSSLKGFDAQSTSRLYVRVDKDKSYALYGDYTTPSQNLARALGEYNRSLTGVKLHHETNRYAFNTFAARDNARRVVVELPGNGTSGPYLLSGLMQRQSEKIEIITRDREQPSVILSVVPQTRFSDYTIDGLTDGILFRAPIPSRDANLNPIYIRITYEVDTGGPNFLVAGLDGQFRVGKKLSIGGSFVSDRDIADPFRMYSFNAAYQMGPKTIALVENAITDRRSLGRDSAQRLEVLHESEKVQARLFLGQAGEDFDNPSSLLTRGRNEASLRTSVAVSERARIIAEAIRTRDLTNGGERTGAQIALEHAISNTARLSLGIRKAKESGGVITGEPVDFTSIRARLTSQVPRVPNATVFTEYERAFGGGNRQALSLGGQYQISDRSRVYFVHELISSLEGRYALNDVGDRNATLVGLDTDYMRNGHLFSEYRIRDAIDGRSAEAALGLRNLWTVGRGVRVGTSFERVKPLGGTPNGLGTSEGTAASVALEYVPNDDFKATGRLEGRRGGGNDSYLTTLGLAYKVSPDWTILGRSVLSSQSGGNSSNRSQQRIQLGTAYRPVDNDRWNALAKYEYRGGDAATSFTGDLKRKVHILVADMNYQPMRSTQLRMHYAYKKATSGGSGLNTAASAHLTTMRITREIGRRYQLGLFAGLLMDGEGGNGRQYGLGMEASRLLSRDLMLSVGYNLLGFRDPDLSIDNSTMRGFYTRLRWKFDEDLFGGLLRSEDRLERARVVAPVAGDGMSGNPLPFAPGDSPAGLDTVINEIVGDSDVLTDEETAKLDDALNPGTPVAPLPASPLEGRLPG